MELRTKLTEEVAAFRAAAFADNTKKTYRSQLKSYYKFCQEAGLVPVPMSHEVITWYAAYLARRLKPSSIKQYLNVVRLIHLDCGYDNPCKDNWPLKTTLTGIERILGNPTNRKTPVTPTLLLQIQRCLGNNVKDRMFWAAALVMFFGTFRKSNLLPDSVEHFNPEKQFVRADIGVLADGSLELSVKWSKTNQFKRYSYVKKLYRINHSLCPASAVDSAFQSTPLPTDAPAFVIDRAGTPMTGKWFNQKFKGVIKLCGLDPKHFASHSFRRGSASWALQCGVPGEIVQHMGDWKSLAYLSYVDQLPQTVYDRYMHICLSKLPD